MVWFDVVDGGGVRELREEAALRRRIKPQQTANQIIPNLNQIKHGQVGGGAQVLQIPLQAHPPQRYQQHQTKPNQCKNNAPVQGRS